MRSFYQDRLGTNIGKTQNKDRFLKVESSRLQQLGEYLNMVQALQTGGASARAWLFEFVTAATIDKA
jgi:hypothetical protein